MKALATFAAVLLLTALAVTPVAAEPVRVVTSFSILGDLVKQVGGEEVAVTTLVGPDGDAHVYEPTPADARAVAGARLVVVNGLGFEGWLDRLVKGAGYKGPVVVASDGVTTLHMEIEEGHGHGHGKDEAHEAPDPHAWQSLANGRLYVANIAKALAVVAPEHAGLFSANAARYTADLTELETWVRAEIGKVPAKARKVITGHDAFGYFANAYGVTLLAPVGVSTEAEPTAADVARLIRQMKKEKVTAVFVENMTDSRLVTRIASETGATPGGTLYADALSTPAGPAASYTDMFRHNVRLLVAGMLGNRM